MGGTHNRTSPLAVRRHNPRTRTIVYVLAGLVVVTVIVGAYFYGEYRGGYQRWVVEARHRQLVHERDALAKSTATLRERITFLERSHQIDVKARQRVQQANVSLQDQIAELKKKLAFYNDIVATGDVHSGLRIQALDVVATSEPGRYHYNLVLMRGPQKDWPTSGTVAMTVVGQRNGEQVALDLASLSSDSDTGEQQFKIRYFENMRGELTLPANFKPAQIKVTVTQKGKDSPLTRSFDWQVTG